MNVRNPDIIGPCRHLKTGAGYALNMNISRTYNPPCFNRRGRINTLDKSLDEGTSYMVRGSIA
jgi:hypothetical protein